MCFNATNMATTKYEHLTDSVGKKVTLLGWVDKVKEQKRFTFITLRMGLAQTVQVVSSVKGVTPESFLQVSGVVSKLPEGAYSTLPVEIQCESDGIVVISPADSSYSTRCPPEAGPEVRLVERHLYLRDPQFALITRLRGILMRAIRAHFDGTGCTEITPPSFTGVEYVKFPKEFKSFYMALDPEDPTRVLGCDVEVPGVGEIVGSGVREGDYTRLTARLLESGLKPEDYAEYLDMRKFGFGMTSGMGLGVDRMLTWLLGKTSIREVVTFPRFPGYLRP